MKQILLLINWLIFFVHKIDTININCINIYSAPMSGGNRI